jgi:hypothetical protein
MTYYVYENLGFEVVLVAFFQDEAGALELLWHLEKEGAEAWIEESW